MLRQSNVSSLAAQRGVGLIEVLIALLVLSIGMLGMAGLQTWSLRNNQSAMQRGQAVVQAYYIADVMRADRTNAVNGLYNIALADAIPAGTTFVATSRAGWRLSLTQELGPEATGSIACNGPACTVLVQWNDSRAQQGSPTQTITLQVDL
jgi:type IV pilus assembly protein PilV